MSEVLAKINPEDEAKFIKLFLEGGGNEGDIESLTGIDMRKYSVKYHEYEYGLRVSVVNILDEVLKELRGDYESVD